MNSCLSVSFALLLAAGSATLQSQSYPTGYPESDPASIPQNPSNPCTDTFGDTSQACAQNLQRGDYYDRQQQQQRDSLDLQGRRPSQAGTSEDSNLNNPTTTDKSQRRTIPLPPEPPTEFQRFVAAIAGQLLPVYGANLFRDVPTTFSPNDLAPVTADYVIGPDDELRVRIWGQVTYSGNLRVDRSGNIYLEGVGAIKVGGLQFSNLDQHLRAAVSRVYRNFDLSVDMGRIRSIQVYVTGQARRPGAYTISSLSSLVNALFASGGPSVQGSLRHVQLNRDGKTITDFDFYELLIHGDKSKDVRLLPEDVLYIPPVGPQVAITGSIHNPGIYELRGNETVGDLIELAGRATTVASNARISVERIVDHQLRGAMETGLDKEGLGVTLADGDILRIYSILPAYRKTITLRGNVANPGRFSWHEGMHISDLIPDRDSLVSRDYWWKRSHLGLPAPEFEPLISRIGRDPFTPESNREGFTTAVSQDTLTSALTRRPQQGANDVRTDNVGADNSGTDNSAPDYVSRTDPDGLQQNYATRPDQQNQGRVSNTGGTLGSRVDQMSKPGETSARVRNDVRIAAPEIYWGYAVVERLNPETLRTSLLPFDLGQLVLKHDATQDLALEPGDTITIFSQGDIRVPLEQQTKYVRLEGEFIHAGVYSALPGETLRDLVRRAGGLAGKAYLYGSEFDRESTRVLQQQRIDEYVNRVELDAERGTLALTASATSSAGSLASTTGARAAEQELVSRLKQIRATGRIVLRIPSDSRDIDDLPNIDLENGDRFIVPPVPATINLVGAVNDQSSFEYQRRETVGQYLLLAGGTDRDADRGHEFVIRADGSVVGRSNVKGLWGNRFNELHLNPGDTIVVPDKTLRPTALRGLLDWTQIFSQLAIGAAAVNVLR